MDRVLEMVKDQVKKRKRYFQRDEREISQSNMRILQQASLTTVLLLIVFLLLTPVILKGWEASPQHMAFLPFSFAFYIVSVVCQRKNIASRRLSTFICVLYNVMMFSFIILIDVFGDPSAPSSFMPLLCIVLPALFIIPFFISFSLAGFFTAVYIAAVLAFKDSAVAYNDVFNSLAGISFSAFFANFITALRAKDFEIRMEYRALSRKDLLTGLYNKRAGRECIQRYLSSGSSASCTMLVLDLDDFKQINDVHGHYMGDVILGCMGRALRMTFHKMDIIGRFGGDEFFVLLLGLSDEKVVRRKCRRLSDTFKRMSRTDSGIRATCSIGAVLSKGTSADFDSLFREADEALYEAKALGMDQFVLRFY